MPYGMGQYRFNKNFNYINKIFETNNSKRPLYIDTSRSADIHEFQDIVIPLTNSQGSSLKLNSSKVYYLHLELPQHREYTLTLNLKLGRMTDLNSASSLDKDRYQFIREISLLPSPNNLNETLSERVILYVVPTNGSEKDKIAADTIKTTDNDDPHNNTVSTSVIQSKSESNLDVYKINNTIINQYNIMKIDKTWLAGVSEETATTSFDIVFQPSFNITEEDGYDCLWLEIQRQQYDNEIQYIGSDGNTYKGTYLDIQGINASLYTVTNLLTANELTTGNSSLTHVAVWSNPEFMFSINGEQLQTGQTNFYELNDFNITFFGAIVHKDVENNQNSLRDRFTVDYQYKIN